MTTPGFDPRSAGIGDTQEPERAALEFVRQTLGTSQTSVLPIDDDHRNVDAAPGFGWRIPAPDSAMTRADVNIVQKRKQVAPVSAITRNILRSTVEFEFDGCNDIRS